MNIAFLSGSGLAIFAVYMLNHAIANYRRADASLTWPSVNGRLTDVRLWGKRNIGGEMKPADKLAVEYIYELNGKKYTGRSPTFYTLVYPRTVEFAERYSSREEVEVHYNPNEPSESVLTPGLNPDKPHSDLILGALAIVAGVSIAILGWLKIIG